MSFRIVLYAADEPHVRAAADTAFYRMKQLNHILSDYDGESVKGRVWAFEGLLRLRYERHLFISSPEEG